MSYYLWYFSFLAYSLAVYGIGRVAQHYEQHEGRIWLATFFLLMIPAWAALHWHLTHPLYYFRDLVP